ncbi:formin-like protein 13 [Parambassis ranga]|uniref:Formin-like protein 13 n=1 Tax=Parambassis ranga TaxID=210632 RepID=A0A6P7IBF5_9TELE|nr:formin-like protein 13 [Parambassis ranga]
MPTLGSKKKDSQSRADWYIGAMPQLSNEMQLSIMNRVKNGEISIDDALNQAREGQEQLLKQKTLTEEEQQPSQYNFSVHKHGRYRWQKRVLQMDFKTKMLCSIEKGIVKRQLPFSIVKSCDDGVGSKFTISFKGHHDYELEAKSLEDKHKIMQLVHQIIYGNIYSDLEDDDAETHQQPKAPQSLREGVLLLHRGGLASFKWVKYEVQLHPGQLTLVPLRQQSLSEEDLDSCAPVSIVIHLSDGDTSVQKPHSADTFILITHKNEYQFRVDSPEQPSPLGAVETERDAWVQAIDKLCSDWKRRSLSRHMSMETMELRHTNIAEDTEDTDLESSRGFLYPPADRSDADHAVSSGQIHRPAGDTRPVPKPRRHSRKASAHASRPESLSPVTPASPASPPPSPCPATPSPCPATPSPSSRCPQPPESGSTVVRGPLPPPPAPPPPPLPFSPIKNSNKTLTKAFHWDLVGSEKITKSFWIQEGSRRPGIDMSRLQEQFSVKDVGTCGAPEASNTQHIMLNQKIAHNFNIFLKSFPVHPGELKDKLFILNEEDGGLSDEHITSLRRYVPTADDVEMYKSHKGPVTELHIVDQYMMEMCNIPYLSTQLDLLLTVRELPVSVNDLQPLINQKIRMCTQLHNSRSFVSVLEYLLAIGNYLNENAGKEKAKGFRLSSLTKLSQLRGRDRRFTLLHALVEQIMLQEPCLATFTQELAEFETVPGASIKGLTAEVDVLKNELQKVIQYRKTSKKRNAAAHPPNFSKDLKATIDKYNVELSALTKTCEEMKKLYSVILVKFGEPADQDSQELFGVINQFIHDFKRAKAETV